MHALLVIVADIARAEEQLAGVADVVTRIGMDLWLFVAVISTELNALDAADGFGIHAARVELALVQAVLVGRRAFRVAGCPVACVLFSIRWVRELAREAAALAALRPAFEGAQLSSLKGFARRAIAKLLPDLVFL